MKKSEKDKVATYVARVLVCCIGIILIIVLGMFKLWKTARFEELMMLGAMIGLCLGYGLGGDIWGVRLFGLFIHLNNKRWTKEELAKQNETPFFSLMGKVIFIIAVCFVIVFSAILIIAHRHRE